MEPHRPTRNETPLERDDRNFVELLQELRVIQTGVQILFAFLLTLAFTPRFPELDDVQRGTYVITLLLSALTAMLFTAPAVVHRALFRRGAKRRVVEVSAKLAATGLAVLGLALTGAVLLVVDFVLGRGYGVAVGAATLAACAALWIAVPWRVRHTHARANGHTAARQPDAGNRDVP
ncbi:DUF6328 family protein [Streptomyces sp. TRM 70351]|uniref:DUF6328 family protein n=1 Tax=Streptomyces sp. TRM 70351 TaxID=3116552 RepID=UPI002E7B9F85|nr:DUF6328 family protein [Streptomyces sp. TRM 70351]MEE1930737.1 DUF6328 family protein [Streptomyces sp. TRM 70351]